MSRHDPTDDVLAAIASIFDKSDAPLAVEKKASPASSDHLPRPVMQDTSYQGYTRSGPGPLDAIRFKWTARRDDNGRYFVDETIGDQSHAISSGPMPESELVAFIDARVQEAHDRFDKLKADMTVAPSNAHASRAAPERAHADYDVGDDEGF